MAYYERGGKFPQFGHDGLSYFGLFAIRDSHSEIIEASFNEKLKKGKEYKFSCWVSKLYDPLLPPLNEFYLTFSSEKINLKINQK